MAVYTSPFFGLIFHDYASRLRHSAQSFRRFVEDSALHPSLMHSAPGGLIKLGHVHAWQKGRIPWEGFMALLFLFWWEWYFIHTAFFLTPAFDGLEHLKDSIPLSRL